MNNCVAIITARGGSKRIPRKNIKHFLGIPIIKYSIDAALQAGCFEEVMVSTEDEEIANVALGFGANVPFMRSLNTSGDFASTVDVIIEVLQKYKTQGKEFGYFCCIYPTAPFVTALKLRSAYNKLIEGGADGLVPVVRFDSPILRSLRIESGLVKMNWPEHTYTRSQDLAPAFHDSGQFYIFRTETFLKKKSLFTDFTIPFELSNLEVQDIDNEEDWKIAELKFKLMQGNDRNS